MMVPPQARIALRSPCFAQALGDHPWSPVQRMRWTLATRSTRCVSPMVTRPTHALDPGHPFDACVAPTGQPLGRRATARRGPFMGS